MFLIIVLISILLFNLISASEELYGYKIRDYNQINIEEVNTSEEFFKRYTVFAGDINVVKNNLLIGAYTPECKDKLLSHAFLSSQRSVGKNLIVSSIPAGEFPIKLSDGACLEVFFYHSGDYIEHPKSRQTDLDVKSFNSWVTKTSAIPNLTLSNHFQFPIAIYSHTESLHPTLLTILPSGNSVMMSSQLGQVISASKLDQTEYGLLNLPIEEQKIILNTKSYKNIVDYFYVNGMYYGFRPENRLFTCEFDPVNPPKSIQGTSINLRCNDMETRFFEFSQQHWYTRRLALNFLQPKIVPAVTNDGFRLMKLPSETYTWLKKWYDQEQLKNEVVEFPAGPCMNQNEAPTLVTHLSPELKLKLSNELLPILEDWYAKGPLTLTSIYGIRKYVNNSELKMHVDTLSTHVVSAIINVDQDVDEDWKLLILDHDENEHHVTMERGDMLLYESAKLLHGRPDPMKGRHYDNIFIHFKPVTGWNYSLH